MKKLFFIAAILGSVQIFAQKIKIEDAAIYLRSPETTIEDAKKAIDEAALNPETKDDLRMWYYRTAIYDTIYRNPEFVKIDKDVVEKMYVSCKKCVDLDVKKKYEEYCLKNALINSGIATYNKGLEYYNAKDYKNAIKFFNYVIDVIVNYDKEGVLRKNNINDKNIILLIADMAMKSGDKPEAKKNLQKLIDQDYNDHAIYLLMATIHLEERDTAKALQDVDMGRKKFPAEKDLINEELYIYQESGKTDLLLKKYDEAIELNPENTLFLYNRGASYDNFTRKANDKANYMKDTAQKIADYAKSEKIPANKTKLNNASKHYNLMADSLSNVAKGYMVRAESDYNKALEVNPDYIDAHYNLGALYNNRVTDVVEKMNSLKAPTQAELDKKMIPYKKTEDSLLNIALMHFNKALELAEALPEDTKDKRMEKAASLKSIYFGLQNVYKNMDNMKKTIEMRNKRMVLELPGEKKSKLISIMGEPKNISKSTSDGGAVIETWTYDGLIINIVNGEIKDVTETGK